MNERMNEAAHLIKPYKDYQVSYSLYVFLKTDLNTLMSDVCIVVAFRVFKHIQQYQTYVWRYIFVCFFAWWLPYSYL